MPEAPDGIAIIGADPESEGNYLQHYFDSRGIARVYKMSFGDGVWKLKLSVDDYGTGYSSLSYLRSLPVDTIKIDKSFVLGMREHQSDATIVRSTIDLGHNLGLAVIAEGVETRQLWEDLHGLGCDVAQGYYVGRASPFNDLISAFSPAPLALAAGA